MAYYYIGLKIIRLLNDFLHPGTERSRSLARSPEMRCGRSRTRGACLVRVEVGTHAADWADRVDEQRLSWSEGPDPTAAQRTSPRAGSAQEGRDAAHARVLADGPIRP
jgi:hypothetical protein